MDIRTLYNGNQEKDGKVPPHPRPLSHSEKGASLSGVIGKHLKLCYVLAPLREKRGCGIGKAFAEPTPIPPETPQNRTAPAVRLTTYD
ncbi:MAG TPA: hypothetical protein VHO90_10590 [Bacteroidales bacterium]|nr:hypothetical protein [Bacteroidales bacterium]